MTEPNLVEDVATAPEEETLLNAVKQGAFNKVENSLNSSPNLVNLMDKSENLSIFELAIQNGFRKIAQYIVQHENFDLDSEESNPLFCTLKYGEYDLATDLIVRGSNPNFRQTDGQTPFLFCLEKQHFTLAKLMLEHGGEIDTRNQNGETPLMFAAKQNKRETIAFLLEHGAKVGLCDKEGSNALMHAYIQKHEEIIELLESAGETLNASFYEDILITAYKSGEIDKALECLEFGANPNCCDAKDNPLVILAARDAEFKLFNKLLELKANINVKSAEGMPLIAVLAQLGFNDQLECILQAGANINLTSLDGFTALDQAVKHGQQKTVELLIKHKANLNSQVNDLKWTALMIAAYDGNIAIVKQLLAANANTKLTDKNGNTAKAIARKRAPRDSSYNRNLEDSVYRDILGLLTLPGKIIDSAY